MTLFPIDWVIIAVYLAGCVVAGVWMRRYIRNVDDFAVAGREMDLNLGVASLAATEVGIVTVMYTAEMGFKNGLAGATPGVLGCLAMLLVGMTGFVIVPLRKAGVITIPELFEKRFGKRVRWLAGLVVILGGVLNMGIFLRVGGEFLMYVAGLDPKYTFALQVMGFQWHLGLLEVTMTSLLAVVLLYTVLGGMVSVLVTDYLQFIVMGLGIVITSVLVVWNVGWPDLLSGLSESHQSGEVFEETQKEQSQRQKEAVEELRRAEGPAAAEDLKDTQAQQRAASLRADAGDLARKQVLVDTKDEDEPKAVAMTDPFNPVLGFGWAWIIWQALHELACMTTWQTTISRVLSARDARTAKKIYTRTSFYFVGRFALPGLWGAAAFLYFCSLGGLPEGVGSLTAMPKYLNTILGPGLIGIMIAAMLAAEMSTDSGYLLTWATVMYNDLINPCLRRPLSPKAKLFTVRAMVLAIGVFLVFYGLWYKVPGRAWDYLSVTGNIYLASLFTLLVGALYWRGANSWGAVAAIVLGAVGPLTFLVVNAIVKDPDKQISPELAGLAAFILSFAGMIVGSWLGRALGRGRGSLSAADTSPQEAST